ncbi:hypothetical protein ACM1RC_28615 [Paenibacillus azoreducens]|uniref:hypothetical protein n=1 Tax=Paenibacillus azoreducens TaxID=116718 RepID=UPI0026CF1AD0
MLRIKDFRMLLLPLGMILIVLPLVIAPNIAYYNNHIVNYWPYLDVTFSVLLPLLLLVGYAIRKRV